MGSIVLKEFQFYLGIDITEASWNVIGDKMMSFYADSQYICPKCLGNVSYENLWAEKIILTLYGLFIGLLGRIVCTIDISQSSNYIGPLANLTGISGTAV